MERSACTRRAKKHNASLEEFARALKRFSDFIMHGVNTKRPRRAEGLSVQK